MDRFKYILIAIFLVVLGVSGYFGYTYYVETTKQTVKTPTNTEDSIAESLQKVVQPTDGVDVTVTSSIPGVKAEFKNKDALLSFLESQGFWKENGVFDPNQKVRRTIKNLDIVVADEGKLTKSPMISGQVVFEAPDKFILYLPIPTARIELKDPEAISIAANKTLVTSGFILTKNSLSDSDLQVANTLSKNINSANGYIEIKIEN